MSDIMNLAIFVTFVLLLNIPFGYWRANVRKFSLQWILAIHFPVPLIILYRTSSDVGFEFYTYIMAIAAFFFGQKIGALVLIYLKKYNVRTSSCLVMDLVGIIKYKLS